MCSQIQLYIAVQLIKMKERVEMPLCVVLEHPVVGFNCSVQQKATKPSGLNLSLS